MKKWEYNIEDQYIKSMWDEESFLNRQGDEGWELVQVVDNNTDTFTYYFKREKV